jgi:hypothetical protein
MVPAPTFYNERQCCIEDNALWEQRKRTWAVDISDGG